MDALRLAKRRVTSPEKSSSYAACRPESVELARAQFIQATTSPQLLTGSALGKKRSTRELRSSVRSEKSIETKSPVNNRSSALHVARSISSSLRNRFKQAFGKPAFGLPPQQLDAARAHFGDDIFGDVGNGGFDNYHADCPAEEQRRSLYESPWHEDVTEEHQHRLSTIIPVNASNSSLAGSSKSRVTSWTNTTISEPTQETLIERKRLSVIQEDGGPHQPSNSAGTHIGGVSVFRKPLPSQAGRGPDPQRLYSALVRRMNQESAAQLKEPLADLQEHDEETHDSAPVLDAPATQVTNLPPELQTAQSGWKMSSREFEHSQPTHRDSQLVTTISQESLYSQTTNEMIESQPTKTVIFDENSVSGSNLPARNLHSLTDRWIDKSNPYLVSDV